MAGAGTPPLNFYTQVAELYAAMNMDSAPLITRALADYPLAHPLRQRAIQLALSQGENSQAVAGASALLAERPHNARNIALWLEALDAPGDNQATNTQLRQRIAGQYVILQDVLIRDVRLPDQVPLDDAVANASAAPHLSLGLAPGDFDLVARGLADRIHQERRRHLFPRSMEVVDLASEWGAIGATISGAGPSVLVWCGWQETGAVVERLRGRFGEWAEIRRVGFSPVGADVPEV